MKTISLTRLIQISLLAAAFAAPAAFAQSEPTATPPPAAMHDGSMQEGSTAPPPATEPTASADKPKSWKELDANKDGKLGKDEVAGDAKWTADFDAADTNKDGSISKAEFKKHEADLKKMASNDTRN